MTALENIFPAANKAALDGCKTSALPEASGAKREPFAQVLSQAMGPRVQNPQPQKNFARMQKRNPADSNPPAIPALITDESPKVASNPGTPLKTKDRMQKDNDADQDATRPVQSEACVTFDASQNSLIYLIAPTYLIGSTPAVPLLESFAAAAPKSSANPPASVTTLPTRTVKIPATAAAATVPDVAIPAQPAAVVASDQVESDSPQPSVATNSEVSMAATPKLTANLLVAIAALPTRAVEIAATAAVATIPSVAIPAQPAAVVASGQVESDSPQPSVATNSDVATSAAPKPAANPPASVTTLPTRAVKIPATAAAATVPDVAIPAQPPAAVASDQVESSLPQPPVATSSGAEKIPAEITDVKTTSWTAVVPQKSEPVEAGAGDDSPKIVEAIPTADAQQGNSGNPGDPGVVQNPTATPIPFTPAKSHGTFVAKQDMPMKNAGQTNEVAEPGEKVLPGKPVPFARENNLPGRENSVLTPSHNEPMGTNVTTVAAQDNPVRSPVPADEVTAVSNFSDMRSQALERTHDLVMQHALRLTDPKADSLQVVIKPDAGTQLSLELRQRGNGIEAQAVLQQGDFEHLKQHWPELQQRLEQRGIKLAPLTSDGNFTAGSGSQGFKNQQNQPAEREPILTGAFAGFAPAGTRTILPDKPATQTASSRGWQKWA
jgi:hypothetical protein